MKSQFFNGITIDEIIEIRMQLEQNKVDEEKYQLGIEYFNWYKDRFKIPHAKDLKFYKELLAETKMYIKYHKELWRKNRDNTLAEDSMNGYIQKEKKLVQRIRFLKENTTHKTQCSIADAKQIPITQFMEFNSAGFAKCLWHNEKTPSLKYNKEKNKVHCFGACGQSRDVIDVVQKIYGITISEAIKTLCNSK